VSSVGCLGRIRKEGQLPVRFVTGARGGSQPAERTVVAGAAVSRTIRLTVSPDSLSCSINASATASRALLTEDLAGPLVLFGERRWAPPR
jgi:hypothetical protein